LSRQKKILPALKLHHNNMTYVIRTTAIFYSPVHHSSIHPSLPPSIHPSSMITDSVIAVFIVIVVVTIIIPSMILGFVLMVIIDLCWHPNV
jgi:hypothetical protein